MCLKFNQTASKGETTKPKIKPSSMDKDRAQKVMSLLQKGKKAQGAVKMATLKSAIINLGWPFKINMLLNSNNSFMNRFSALTAFFHKN
jgi:hypothetical protein